MNDRYEIINSRILKNYDCFLKVRDKFQKKTFIVSFNNESKELRATEIENVGRKPNEINLIDSLVPTDLDKIKLFYCMCKYDSRFLYYVPDQFKTKEICEVAVPKEQPADDLVDILKQLDKAEKELLSKLEKIRNKRNNILEDISHKNKNR